jgi:cell division septation protein DedD
MLKFFFWILVLANAGLLVYQQGYLETLLPSGHEPARMDKQLNADKIKLIPEPARVSAPVAPPAPPAPSAPPPEPAPVTASITKNEELLVCVEVGNFDPDEARQFSTRLAPLALGRRVSQRTVQEATSHMVYIPPLADKESAEKKVNELRRLGVTDLFLIQDNSSMRWAISLGVFKQAEAARAHLTSLNQKGVRSARIIQRGVASNMVAFRLRDIDANAKSAVEKIKAGFPKQDMRNCE